MTVRHHMTKQASVCLLLWVPLRPTSLLYSSYMRISRRRKCAGASRRNQSKMLHCIHDAVSRESGFALCFHITLREKEVWTQSCDSDASRPDLPQGFEFSAGTGIAFSAVCITWLRAAINKAGNQEKQSKFTEVVAMSKQPPKLHPFSLALLPKLSSLPFPLSLFPHFFLLVHFTTHTSKWLLVEETESTMRTFGLIRCHHYPTATFTIINYSLHQLLQPLSSHPHIPVFSMKRFAWPCTWSIHHATWKHFCTCSCHFSPPGIVGRLESLGFCLLVLTWSPAHPQRDHVDAHR